MTRKYRWLGLAALLTMFLMGVGMNKLPVMASETDVPEEGEETTEYHSDSGKCGANITWTLEEGVLTLEGSGAMNNYMSLEPESPGSSSYLYVSIAPWKEYAEEINTLVLDDRITAIGEGAFYGIHATGKLKLPSALKTIGDYAFEHCEWFDMEIEFPETLTTIGDFAFDQFANDTYWDTNNNQYDPTDPNWRIKNDLYFSKNLKSVGICAFQGYSGVDKVFVENPKMEFGSGCIEGVMDIGGKMLTVIYGASGSTAQTYAKECGWEFREWVPGKTHYTVTFDSAGGTSIESQKVEIGACAVEPTPEPEKYGYYFMGWYLDDVRFDFSKPVSGDITLVARWSGEHPVEIPLVVTLDNQLDSNVLSWESRNGSGLQRYEIWRALMTDDDSENEGSNGGSVSDNNIDSGNEIKYEKIGEAEATEDSYSDTFSKLVYEKSRYQYKVTAVYEIKGVMRSTPDSNVVSARGMIYGNPEDVDPDCIGVLITDAEGNPVKSLALHVGESSPELHVQYQYRNGTTKDWREVSAGRNNWLNWYVNDTVDPSNDWTYAKFLPTMDYLGVDPDAKGASAQLVGVKAMDAGKVQYVSVVIQGKGSGQISIPVTVVEAEEGADYGEVKGLDVCESVEDAYQALRDSFKAREDHPFVLMTDEAYQKFAEECLGEGVEDNASHEETEDFIANVFDFYEDRPGMKSDEGDYLMEGITSYLYTLRDNLHYGASYREDESEYYQAIYFLDIEYITTREQEDWMDEQVRKLFDEPGGRFYDYKHGTHTEYEKIKAVYDYVSSELGIKWVNGTNKAIYHTAYSALHDRRGTCQSWALLFYRFTRELGISSRVLMGVDSGAHTYNIVQLEGDYYYVDCSNGRFLQGSKSFKSSPLQEQWCTERFQKNYIAKISPDNYGGSAASSIKSITVLNDAQIAAIDSNLISTSTKMSAAYKISGSKVTVTNASKTVLGQVYGCSEYLGLSDADKETAKKEWGYYLALRVNVDAAKFVNETDNTGSLKIAYNLNGNRVTKAYTMADSSTLKDGYVDAILKLTDSVPSISITADYDKEGKESTYQPATYNFDVSSLKKQDSDKFGTVKEISDMELSHGIETSSPRVKSQSSGQNMTVTYDSVAKSMKVDKDKLKINSEDGYYIALQVNAPEAMKGTKSLDTDVAVALVSKTTDGSEGSGTGITAQDLLYESAEDNSYVRLFMPAVKDMNETVNITWAGEQTQTVVIETAPNCIFETINERAVLPKSVKFNGLQKTMYVGQSQTADTAITRNYEQDEVRLVFASSDSSIVGINRITGEMEAFRPGTATITVTMTDGTGSVPLDKKGNVLKGMTASAKITVKVPTAPGSIKLTEISDTSMKVNWKANTTGQMMEIYALPVNKNIMGNSKNNWKAAIETALAEEGMNRKLLSSMSHEEQEALCRSLEARFDVKGCVLSGSARADEKSADIKDGLQRATGYVFYLRNITENQVGEVYYTGAVSGETKTKTKVLSDIILEAQMSDGKTLSGALDDQNREVFTITTDSLEQGPKKITYTVRDEKGAVDNSAVYTKPTYKSSNTKVVKVNNKGVLTLGGQAGIAELYVTGKDSAGKVRESQRIYVKVVKEPNKLANKTTTLALGARIELKDLVGYNTKGATEELKLEKVDFDALLNDIKKQGCFKVTPAADGNIARTTITAADFVTDAAKGNKKAGNSVKLPVSLYQNAVHGSEDQPISEAVVTLKVTDMAQPAITKVTPKDTYVTVKFKPAATVPVLMKGSAEYQQYEANGENYYYTVSVTDKATGQALSIPEEQIELTLLEEDKNAKTPLYTYTISGLTEEYNYSVQITAHYDTTASGGTQGTTASRTSAAKNFKTLKLLLGSGGAQTDGAQTQIRYISLPQLRSTPSAAGDLITYVEGSDEEIVLRNNETYVFMAQVSKLNRVLGTDKLKWTVSSGTKGIATIKATGDTYQAQLTTQRTGTFTVTVTSTVSKETLAVFRVKVVPYQTQSQAPSEPESGSESQAPDETESQMLGETDTQE